MITISPFIFPEDFPEDLQKQRIWFSGNNNVIGPVLENIPFVVIGSCDLACIHGRPRKKKKQHQNVRIT